MSRRIVRLTQVYLALLLLISAATAYWQVVRGEELRESEYNPRRIEEERRALRGRILDRRGVELAATQDGRRRYAFPALAHVTGFFSLRYGTTGIERAYDGLLSGRASEGPISRTVRSLLHQPRRGGHVQLTVDAELQRVADRAIGNAHGAVVLLDVRTGEIIVLLSKPLFDPNRVDADWERLRAAPAASSPQCSAQTPCAPLLNRATQGLYAPGSTFKVVTAAAALDSRLLQPNTPLPACTGAYVVEGFRIACQPRCDGVYDLTHALVYSCNAAFGRIGNMLGEARLREYARRFGIGAALPLEIATAPTQFASGTNLSQPAVASTAFGQGELLMTPLQMALVAATVASGGELPAPQLVLRTLDRSGNTLEEIRPRTLGRAMSQQAAQQLTQMMVLAVEQGYGFQARIPGVRVAGKTGTAQSSNDPRVPDHSWFIGFAPADRPRYAIAVMMEFSGWGSLEAAPVARQVLEAALARPG